MTNPVPSYANPVTVEAFLYETQLYTIDGAPYELTIYIPSFDISVINNGHAHKYQITSKKARIALMQYFNECDSGKRKDNEIEMLDLTNKANKEASKVIRVSSELAEKIHTLIEEKETLKQPDTKNEARINAIDTHIKRLAKLLFL